MARFSFCCVCVAIALFGCGQAIAVDEQPSVVPPARPGVPGTQDVRPPATSDFVPGDPFNPLFPAEPPQMGPSEVPTDDRVPVAQQVPPPPISGGTLLITRDGATAVVADPDRDRVVFVDIRTRTVRGEVALGSGAEPGRTAQDADGRVHVALRGSGKLATIDLDTRELIRLRDVCGAPRGVAYDASLDALHVACLDGDLVTMPAGVGAELRRLKLGADLRDVIVTGSGLRVTRFRSAEVIDLDAAGAQLATHSLPAIRQQRFRPLEGDQVTNSFEPTLARRALALSSDSTIVLHQRAMVDAIELDDPHSADGVEGDLPEEKFPGGDSSYGGGDGCTAIVQTAVSVVDGDGTVRHTQGIGLATLPVDLAVSPDRRRVAVVDAGRIDPSAPSRFFLDDGGLGGGVNEFSLVDGSMTDSTEFGEGCMTNNQPLEGQTIAVAYAPDGALFVQSREPALLHIVSSVGIETIELGGQSRQDTGHDIFHRNAGAGIACASCHGEGGDDGHVWSFTTLGPRRTQSVNVGLDGTAPFHWSGDMRDLPALVSEVFVQRMGGANQSAGRVDALAGWLFALHAPKSIRSPDDATALRGKQLFDSDEVACSSCHNGDKLTNNKTVDVGTGEPLQVPSLVGIAYRAPFIHDGCAATLRDRFNPSCGGGDRHGHTSQLDDDQLDDLVAYLESL